MCVNGYLSFDISVANWGSGYNGIGDTLPYFVPDTPPTLTFLLRATIMGMFSTFDARRCIDLAPSSPGGFPQCSSPYDRRIQWRVEGSAPSRKFIASY